MTTVGPEDESCVPQAAQVVHDLAVSWRAKVRLFQNRFLELGVSDLTVRRGFCAIWCPFWAETKLQAAWSTPRSTRPVAPLSHRESQGSTSSASSGRLMK